jgi:Tfp pilus assembly protein PilN
MATLDTQLGEIRLLKERRKELIDRMQLIEQLQMRRNIPSASVQSAAGAGPQRGVS